MIIKCNLYLAKRTIVWYPCNDITDHAIRSATKLGALFPIILNKCSIVKRKECAMNKNLSPWCKLAWHALIDKGLSVRDVAEGTGMNRSYVSTIINGRVYSQVAVKRISDFLGIPDSAVSTCQS